MGGLSCNMAGFHRLETPVKGRRISKSDLQCYSGCKMLKQVQHDKFYGEPASPQSYKYRFIKTKKFNHLSKPSRGRNHGALGGRDFPEKSRELGIGKFNHLSTPPDRRCRCGCRRPGTCAWSRSRGCTRSTCCSPHSTTAKTWRSMQSLESPS